MKKANVPIEKRCIINPPESQNRKSSMGKSLWNTGKDLLQITIIKLEEAKTKG